MQAAIEIKQVDQFFRSGFWMKKKQILFGVDLQVHKNLIFGFVGDNGAGKTSLIHLITGLKTPARGRVEIFGHPAASIEARRRIGYLPERPYFHEHLTGLGFLRYFGVLSGMSQDWIRQRSDLVLRWVGLQEAARLELRKYSKGMLQRIGIAQAILHDPEILVLDEPMSGLDPSGRKEVRELISLLGRQGKTIFFSTHVLSDVEEICDEVAMIQKGKMLQTGSVQSFLAQGQEMFEVVFSVSNENRAQVSGLFDSLREEKKGLTGFLSSNRSIEECLSHLLALSAKIHSVHPVRPRLEDFFGNRSVEQARREGT
ncbi:MAG: ABC transporter ATP-binding protein [Bdellovibrionia bacterium]